MPLASISNAISTFTPPFGAGGNPPTSNCPSNLLCAAISRSPWYTLMENCDWLSAVETNCFECLVGIVELRDINRVKTPPRVSIPRDRGVTSKSVISLTLPCKTPPWIAAPKATASSGFTALEGSFPKIFRTMSFTNGVRVLPPTKSTSSRSLGLTPASLQHFTQGSSVLLSKGSIIPSKSDLDNCMLKCFGPVWSIVMNGRLTSVCFLLESSIFAASAASRNRCKAMLSFEISIP
mmetsp:Transcript_76625/g.120988  ORF Transcript_76625/g.120988 Transcript_76625/m.120988 type:complete len:236 (+) Transcript_76625:442-1149(+)